MSIADGETHGYILPNDEKQTTLWVGIPKGEQRPAVWITTSGSPTRLILGRFNGPNEAETARKFLDAMLDSINRAIANNKGVSNG